MDLAQILDDEWKYDMSEGDMEYMREMYQMNELGSEDLAEFRKWLKEYLWWKRNPTREKKRKMEDRNVVIVPHKPGAHTLGYGCHHKVRWAERPLLETFLWEHAGVIPVRYPDGRLRFLTSTLAKITGYAQTRV